MSFCLSFVALISAILVVTLPNAVFGQDHYSGCPAEEQLSWSYGGRSNGPSKWGNLYPDCNKDQQSPINIDSTKAVNDGRLQKLEFSNYDKPINNAPIENIGFTIRVYFNDGIKRTFTLDGSTYTLQTMDFCLGSDPDQGTEHAIDGKRYAMEVQLTHVNSQNASSVVSVLFEQADESNSELKVLTTYFKDVKFKDDKTTLQQPIDLSAIIPENPASFYTYKGSSTYPACAQGVLWVVFKKTMSTNENQMHHFRNDCYLVKKEDKDPRCKIVNNNRPLQPLKDDTVVSASD